MSKNPVIEKAISIVGTQQKLAELSGISQPSIHKLLYIKSKDMRFSTALALSKATGINIEEFIANPSD